MNITMITIGLFVGLSAFASTMQSSEETSSRALQQARRVVASMRNDKAIAPSRAVWLGQRVAKNSRLALSQKAESKPIKKKSPSSQN